MIVLLTFQKRTTAAVDFCSIVILSKASKLLQTSVRLILFSFIFSFPLSKVYINDTHYFIAAPTGKYNAAQPNVFIKCPPVVKAIRTTFINGRTSHTKSERFSITAIVTKNRIKARINIQLVAGCVADYHRACSITNYIIALRCESPEEIRTGLDIGDSVRYCLLYASAKENRIKMSPNLTARGEHS
jgi:hypothetical protein